MMKKPDEKGQTLVEFALILFLLLVILFGITEFGRGWYCANALTNGVRDGARYASTLPNTTSFEPRVRSYTFARITSVIPTDSMSVDVTAYDMSTDPPTEITDISTMERGDAVRVTATYTFEFLTAEIIPAFGPKTMVRQSTMRYE